MSRQLHLCASCNEAQAVTGHARSCPWYGIDDGTWATPPEQQRFAGRDTRHRGRSIEDVSIPDVLMPATTELPERPVVGMRFHLRDEFLPQPGQTYLALPGIRPDRGACPECGAAENLYCAPDCVLVDPYAKDSAERLHRCIVCSVRDAKSDELSRHNAVILIPKRGVRHLVSRESDISLCHMVTVRHGAMIVPGVKW